LGLELALACPPGFDPPEENLARHACGAKVTIVRDPKAACEGADVLSTDVWRAWAGHESEGRKRAFDGFSVTTDWFAWPRATSWSSLPARAPREEIEADVIDGPRASWWDQAEAVSYRKAS